MYSWHLKMVYCKLDILMKMVSCKVMIIENQHGYQGFRGALGDGSRSRDVRAIRGCRWLGSLSTCHLQCTPIPPDAPMLLHPLGVPKCPLTPLTPLMVPHCPWWPQCLLTPPTPLGSPMPLNVTYTPAGPWVPILPASPQMPLDTSYTPWWSPMSWWTPMPSGIPYIPYEPQCPLMALYPCWPLSTYNLCQLPTWLIQIVTIEILNLF